MLIQKRILDSLEMNNKASTSNCVRKNRQVSALLLDNGNLENYTNMKYSSNTNPDDGLKPCSIIECPRSHMPSGVGTYLCKVIHAEIQAILYAMTKQGAKIPMENKVLFTTLFPCNNCAMFIIRCGIKTIFYRHNYNEDSMVHVKRHLKEAGVNFIKL